MDPATETKAKALFRKGVECERDGCHYEATRWYKLAFKLDPGVEKKIAEEEVAPCCMDVSHDDGDDKSEDEYDNKENLFLRFQRVMGSLPLCTPEHTQKAIHFSSLPPEVILYIFRWVVSYDLDLRTLEQCSSVCRSWYLYARDPELWRRACSKFWPLNVNDLVPYDGSWRIMFIERPNVLTIGCYISKISYVRKGEESFRDNTNGPSFEVEYYRYLRFFSDGLVLMLISSIPPTNVVKKLKTRERAPFSTFIGHYQLSGNKLFLTLGAKYERVRENEHRRELALCTMFERQRLENTFQKKTIYNMVLEILKYKSKHNWKLKCIDYEITYQNPNSPTMVTKYDLNNNYFPPFIFSRVKCYTDQSGSVL